MSQLSSNLSAQNPHPTMLHCALSPVLPPPRPRVCAVSFLNTVPLVWGMMHGPERDLFDLSFSVPSECADRVADGSADIGIIPVAEINRLQLPYLREVGIACRGPVRDPPDLEDPAGGHSDPGRGFQFAHVRDADAHRSQAQVRLQPPIGIQAPKLQDMLANADAALIIGDPALRMNRIRSLIMSSISARSGRK